MKQETRSSKTLKGQLLGAIAMMLVAAIALGTSTYAWFISNQDVKVDAMELTVETSASLMVAVGKGKTDGKPTTWTGYKTVVHNEDITGKKDAGEYTAGADWADMFKNPMGPASITDANLGTAGGATTAALADPAFFYADKASVVNGLLTKFTDLAPGMLATDVGQGYVKRIPLRFLASKATDAYWGDTTNILTSGTPVAGDITKMVGAGTATINGITPADQANGIRAALRVAVVPHNTTTLSASTSITFQFDEGAKFFPEASGNNTDYGAAVENTTINEANGAYRGIGAAGTTTAAAVTAAGPLTAQTPASAKNYIAIYEASAFKTVAATGTPLFKLAANEPRDVDVYIWLDGTDQDCVSALSQYGFKLNMPFAAVPTT